MLLIKKKKLPMLLSKNVYNVYIIFIFSLIVICLIIYMYHVLFAVSRVYINLKVPSTDDHVSVFDLFITILVHGNIR